MSLLIGVYLLLVIALPLALSAAVSYRSLPDGTDCPLCRGETIRLVSRWLRLVSALVRRAALHRRWCIACGWEGTCRVARPTRAARPPSEERRAARPPSGERHPEPSPPARTATGAGALGRGGEAIDLRKLEVDGRAWRVLLQFWCDADRWYGRLLFISPAGRVWADPMEPLTGTSRHDVIGQALALPDGIIVCRLREVVSD